MIVPVLRQPKRSHVAKSLAGKPSTESHLKCHGRTSLLGNTRAIVQHPEPSLISSTAAPDPFCDTEFASSGVACSFRSSISPACSFRLKDRVLFQIHIIATRSCHMQQVQTSQPVVTWTFMKAIFTGTIRSVASCPPASRIREPGVFCRPPRCGCRKLHPGVRRLDFADSDGAHFSYEL